MLKEHIEFIVECSKCRETFETGCSDEAEARGAMFAAGWVTRSVEIPLKGGKKGKAEPLHFCPTCATPDPRQIAMF